MATVDSKKEQRANAITSAPIFLNLDGRFAIPRTAKRYVAGDINPDLRLETLDAFLEQLADAVNDDTAEKIKTALPLVIAEMRKNLKGEIGDANCKLVIGCKINPTSHCMEYTFEVQAAARPRL